MRDQYCTGCGKRIPTVGWGGVYWIDEDARELTHEFLNYLIEHNIHVFIAAKNAQSDDELWEDLQTASASGAERLRFYDTSVEGTTIDSMFAAIEEFRGEGNEPTAIYLNLDPDTKDEDGDVQWESPWGKGRPGWHIECSVMSTELLGNHFDIHCGGVDNIFPHHENEIAQSVCATGEDFVNYWLHSEYLLVDNKKMSKSLNNFYTLRHLLEQGYAADAVRWMLITTHYRQKLNFSVTRLDDAGKAIQRLRDFMAKLDAYEAQGAEDASTIFWMKGNPGVAKLVVSWGKIPVRSATAPVKVPKRDVDKWAWLWANYSYSAEDWLALAGIMNVKYGLRLIERVVRLRLVFPDGTLPDWIEQLISISAIATIDKLTPKEGKDEKAN